MKNRLLTALLTLALFISSTTLSLASCDTCTVPWGPPQILELTGQTINGKPASCTYTFLYEYRTRNCHGEIQVDILNIFFHSETSGPGCDLNNFSDCYHSHRAALRSLANNFAGPITLSEEASCHSMVDVELTQEFIDCAIDPREIPIPPDTWQARVRCDSVSCCKTTLIPLGDGTVQTQSIASIECDGALIIPDTLYWYCMGQKFALPVVSGPGDTDCQPTCDGDDILYKTLVNRESPHINAKHTLNLYPNPAQGRLLIAYDATLPGTHEVEIYSVQGRKVLSLILETSSGEAALNIEQLPAGQYICRWLLDKEILDTRPFQKKETP